MPPMPNEPENPDNEPDVREELKDIKKRLFGIREAVGTAIFFAFMNCAESCCRRKTPSTDDIADKVIEKLKQEGLVK